MHHLPILLPLRIVVDPRIVALAGSPGCAQPRIMPATEVSRCLFRLPSLCGHVAPERPVGEYSTSRPVKSPSTTLRLPVAARNRAGQTRRAAGGCRLGQPQNKHGAPGSCTSSCPFQKIHNPTRYDVSVTVLAENARQAGEPLGYAAFRDWPRTAVKAGETTTVEVAPKP